jgi:hypothetical protein
MGSTLFESMKIKFHIKKINGSENDFMDNLDYISWIINV